MPQMNVIVPMVGTGARFRAAGYPTYKPFMEILGKRMIEWAITPFPETVKKWFIVSPDLLTAKERQFLESIPHSAIIEIEKHPLGPAYSLFKALHALPLEEAFFITYCDIFWTWDFDMLLPHLDQDHIVFTRRSFHPHLVQNNYSAFCLPQSKNSTYLAEIKEKASYTDRWMDEPLSVGVFYIKSGLKMAAALEYMIKTQCLVGKEYFPSLLFNRFLALGDRVFLHDIDFFVHWGTPEQLEDCLYWQKVMTRIEEKQPKASVGEVFKSHICCVGGTGSRMKQLSLLPKPALPVCGLPMVQYIANQFGCIKNELIVGSQMRSYFYHLPESFQFTEIGDQTRSQLETLTRAQCLLASQTQFFLTSCDAYGYFDHQSFEDFVARETPDAVIFTFSHTLTQKKLSSHHTHVSVEGNRISAVHIKSKPHDTDQGLAGFFWFNHGGIFKDLQAIEVPVHQEGSADHVLKYGVENGYRVLAYPLDAYIHLGTQEEYQEFQFWYRYRKVLDAI